MKHAPGFLKLVQEAKSRIQECTVDDVKDRLDRGEQLTIIDVREDREFEMGHIPKAIHLSKGIIERDIEMRFPNHGDELIVYCGGGFRSALVADNLQKMGYTKVISMDGGHRVWKEKGLPLVMEIPH